MKKQQDLHSEAPGLPWPQVCCCCNPRVYVSASFPLLLHHAPCAWIFRTRNPFCWGRVGVRNLPMHTTRGYDDHRHRVELCTPGPPRRGPVCCTCHQPTTSASGAVLSSPTRLGGGGRGAAGMISLERGVFLRYETLGMRTRRLALVLGLSLRKEGILRTS